MSDVYVPEEDDVLLMSHDQSYTNTSTSRICDQIKSIRSKWSKTSSDLMWIKDGQECKLLRSGPGGGWRKGKIFLRMSLEFVPDEPEQPQQTQLEESETLYLSSSEDA